MVARARAGAEVKRNKGRKQYCSEYDREASQLDERNLNDEEKGVLRTIHMGSTLTESKVAEINEDQTGRCDYCFEMDIGPEHYPFKRSYFANERHQADAGIARSEAAFKMMSAMI